ncbi:hypothetical protein NDU88_000383 [Pleurodeles waltl]|uniref:t-SNARE coiled-coil homology domain-containing protein n=1 Tax=Pleurodeles waltl TaxID=8319 RepID=A0AAV7TEY6_PLEWA|nr:hypothetical protein NDU88_000383 [Pleurodeles waltl]
MNRKLDAVLEAVERLGTSLDQTRTSLEQKIDTVATDLNLLDTDHRKLVDKTRTMEHTLHKLTPKPSKCKPLSLLGRVAALERRVDDSEEHFRRN